MKVAAPKLDIIGEASLEMSSSLGNLNSIQGKSLEEQASLVYKTANNTFDQIHQPSNEIEKLKAKLNTMYS